MNLFSPYKRQLLYFLKNKINIDKEKNDKSLSLEDLFVKYGSDKASFWNKSNNGHGYTKFYLKYFNRIRKKKLNILEVGSFSGASAAAFSKFFFNSNIYCLDINISNFKYKSKKIKVFGLDATNLRNIKTFLNKIDADQKNGFFDIIIDDGSHRLEDILKVFKLFFQYLKSNGFYVIEDFKHPNFYKHLNSKNEPKINKLIQSLKKKKIIKSNILDHHFQKNIIKSLGLIKDYKGLLKDSYIAFFKKN